MVNISGPLGAVRTANTDRQGMQGNQSEISFSVAGQFSQVALQKSAPVPVIYLPWLHFNLDLDLKLGTSSSSSLINGIPVLFSIFPDIFQTLWTIWVIWISIQSIKFPADRRSI